MVRTGISEVVEIGLVELVVFLFGHVGLAALPNGNHGVDGFGFRIVFELRLVIVARIFGLGQLARLFAFHLDGIAHIVAVFFDEVLQAPFGKIGVVVLFIRVVFKDNHHVGAVAGALGGFNRVSFDAVAHPAPRLVGAEGARGHAHLFAHHEGGIEAHTELADDIHVVALGLGIVGLELKAAGMRNGAQVLFKLVLGHANTGVRHRYGAGVANRKTHE